MASLVSCSFQLVWWKKLFTMPKHTSILIWQPQSLYFILSKFCHPPPSACCHHLWLQRLNWNAPHPFQLTRSEHCSWEDSPLLLKGSFPPSSIQLTSAVVLKSARHGVIRFPVVPISWIQSAPITGSGKRMLKTNWRPMETRAEFSNS